MEDAKKVDPTTQTEAKKVKPTTLKAVFKKGDKAERIFKEDLSNTVVIASDTRTYDESTGDVKSGGIVFLPMNKRAAANFLKGENYKIAGHHKIKIIHAPDGFEDPRQKKEEKKK